MKVGAISAADKAIAHTVRKPQDLLDAHSAAMRLARGLANAPYKPPAVKSAVDVSIATLPKSQAQLYAGLKNGQQWGKVTYPTPEGQFIDALVQGDAKPTITVDAKAFWEMVARGAKK